MTSLINIERKICIESEFLNKDIKKHLLDKIKLYKNECTKEHGFFINIKDKLQIKDVNISSNCENIFTVVFEAETLKPEVGKKFKGVSCMIFSGGIFLNIKDKLKILILETFLKIDHIFDQKTNTFVNKNTNNSINQGDELNVILTGVTYSNKNFVCFGILDDTLIL
jgi:DNA-directed RNA polymerase subunit E'/Rpb7